MHILLYLLARRIRQISVIDAEHVQLALKPGRDKIEALQICATGNGRTRNLVRRRKPEYFVLLQLVRTFGIASSFISLPAHTGPPFATDDPWTAGGGNHELFLFADAVETTDGTDRNFGIDYAYGFTENLEIAAVVPMSYENPTGASSVTGLSNIVVSAKYLFPRQDDGGLSVAFAPSVSLQSASSRIGDNRAALFLPIWIGKEGENWTTYGGGGCAINRGNQRKDYCFAGLAMTRLISSSFDAGIEIIHQTADAVDAKGSTGVGAGLTYGFNERIHLLLYGGTGIHNRSETNQVSGYLAVLLNF